MMLNFKSEWRLLMSFMLVQRVMVTQLRNLQNWLRIEFMNMKPKRS